MKLVVLVLVAACGHEAGPTDVRPPVAPPMEPHVGGRLTAEERRELAGAIAVPDGVIVRTRKGNLARYDRQLRFVVDSEMPSPVAAIASSGGSVFAALEDHQIVRVDPQTLAVTPVARASGAPRWIGIRGQDVLVFVSADKHSALDTVRGNAKTTLRIELGDSAAATVGAPSTFLLDGDALWFGIDAGEWGGLVGRIDLVVNKTRIVAGSDGDPVFGFVRRGEQVLAYGGLTHLGFANGTISVVGGRVKRVWQAESGIDQQHELGAPVAHAITRGDQLLALSWRTLYDVSADYKQWTKIVELPARARHGRPDSVGSFPATVAMIDLGGVIVFATTQDGLFVWRDGKLAQLPP